jgi:HTH-type transcriptional regulator, transcriptional repressor of NAD biosynthesis genes
LYLVAKEHARRIEKGLIGVHPLLIIDTDIHTTQSYAGFVFGKEFDVDTRIYEVNKAQLYLYLTNDADYHQDGTRMDKAQRDLLDVSHRSVLKDAGIAFVAVSGNWDTRLARAIELVNLLLNKFA